MSHSQIQFLIRDALTRVNPDDRKGVAFSVAGCLWRSGIELTEAREILYPCFRSDEELLVRRALWRAYGPPSGIGTLRKLRLIELAEFFGG